MSTLSLPTCNVQEMITECTGRRLWKLETSEEVSRKAPPQEAQAGGVASQAGLESEGNVQFGNTNQEALNGLAMV